MPLVPLYDQNASDGSHHVRAPGGYESWRIVSYDQKQSLLVYAAVHEGCQSDPAYVRAYRQYLRDPTRRPPPLPQDFRCEETAVYQGRRCLANSFRRIASPLLPITSAAQIHLGQSVLNVDSVPPLAAHDECTFNPSHHWLFSNPLASLRGQLNLKSDQFSFEGIPACRDHRYGPALPTLTQLISGVAFFPDSAIFFLATPSTSWMIRAGRDGIRLIDQRLVVDYNPLGRFKYHYPIGLTLGDAATFVGGIILERSLTRLRLLFHATSNQPVNAFCEITYPRIFGWPVINWFSPRPEALPTDSHFVPTPTNL